MEQNVKRCLHDTINQLINCQTKKNKLFLRNIFFFFLLDIELSFNCQSFDFFLLDSITQFNYLQIFLGGKKNHFSEVLIYHKLIVLVLIDIDIDIDATHTHTHTLQTHDHDYLIIEKKILEIFSHLPKHCCCLYIII